MVFNEPLSYYQLPRDCLAGICLFPKDSDLGFIFFCVFQREIGDIREGQREGNAEDTSYTYVGG